MSTNTSSLEQHPAFRIDQESAAAYRADLEAVLGPLSGVRRVLELGSGTGLFSRFMAGCGLDLLGVDRDPEAVEIARREVPAARFVTADLEAAEPAALPGEAFDLLISRFAIHELRDPISSFQAWGRWMAAGGRLVLVENCWVRQDWGWSDWGKRSNELPLAYTQTWATAGYCLRMAGWVVTHAGWMSAVNALESLRLTAGYRLYVLVACRPEDVQAGHPAVYDAT